MRFKSFFLLRKIANEAFWCYTIKLIYTAGVLIYVGNCEPDAGHIQQPR